MSDGDGDGADGDRGARRAVRARWRGANDTELVAAVRKSDFEALRELYARFEPVLARYASRAGLAIDDWEGEAHDVLCDVVLALIADDARPAVRSVHAYVVRAFRNRMLDVHRASRRREARERSATTSESGGGERLVVASISESAIRESVGATHEAAASSPALARLAHVLDASLSVEERQMLTWVSNAVPMREIAQWLGIGYSAAKVRLSRLRSRLRERALRHVQQCMGAEREELVEFFRRSARVRERALHAVEPGGVHGDD